MISTHDSLGLLLHDAGRAFRKRLDRRMAHLGLSTAQWRLLIGTLRTGGMTQARIAERLEIEPISVSRLVDRMEQAGWVTRAADPNDRRAKIVVPTERARSFHETILAAAREVTAEALANVPEDSRAALMEGLRQISVNLSSEDGATEPAGPGLGSAK